MLDLITKLKNKLLYTRRQNAELIWARVWDDTRNGIDWMKDLPSISPGRYAVGYAYIYILTRVLNDYEPHKILDLGLGISSSIISNYMKHHSFDDSCHTIIEHDPDWISFYTNKNKLSKASRIETVKLTRKELNGYSYEAYENLGSVVQGKKYDLISIDGPHGKTRYSRRDILEFLPAILNDSFVIIIDDSERQGEKATISEIKTILTANNIEFCSSTYSGLKDSYIITSKNNKFLCSL